jgi:FKBP-type peptidyl-prolyl cis-trans isomerase 2
VCYTHGTGEMPETLESLLEGLREGAKLKVKLVPGQGYTWFDQPVLLALQKERVPTEALRVGCELHAETPAGREVRFRVQDVRHRDVVLQADDLLPTAAVLDVAIEEVGPASD